MNCSLTSRRKQSRPKFRANAMPNGHNIDPCGDDRLIASSQAFAKDQIPAPKLPGPHHALFGCPRQT